jgi:sporulation protein YlmC with PRC-barrel domain
VLALGTAVALCPNVWAQENQSDSTTTAAQQREVNRIHRASDVIGANVRNAHGDEMGEIKDFTVEPRSGKIRYVALGVGGTLGVGEKLVALPLDAFMFTKSDGGDDLTVRLNLDQQQLKSAKGFRDEQWPMQPELASATTGKAAHTDIDIQVNRESGVDVDVDRTPRGADSQRSVTQSPATESERSSISASRDGKQIVRASYLMDAKIVGRNNKEIGEVDDLAVDVKAGRVGYFAVQAGGALEIGDSSVAVAWPSVQIHATTDQDELKLVMDMTEAQLENAPALSDDGNWPAPSRIPGFREESPQAGISSP